MTPEQQRIIKALLAGGMPAGDMSGASPLRQRAMMQQAQKAQQGLADAFYDAQPGPSGVAGAGLGGMTAEPFDPREEMSAPMPAQGVPAASPMPNPAPNAMEAVLADMPPQAQQAIMQAVQQGMSPDDAIAQVLGIDMNAISRGQ